MRFRLLSYVCAMLLLAGVVGANLTPVPHHAPSEGRIQVKGEFLMFGYLAETGGGCGWPFTALRYADFRHDGPVLRYYEYNWMYLALNIAIGLAIPIAGLFACEFVLRRWA